MSNMFLIAGAFNGKYRQLEHRQRHGLNSMFGMRMRSTEHWQLEHTNVTTCHPRSLAPCVQPEHRELEHGECDRYEWYVLAWHVEAVFTFKTWHVWNTASNCQWVFDLTRIAATRNITTPFISVTFAVFQFRCSG